MIQSVTESVGYTYIVYGTVPELMARVAYRRVCRPRSEAAARKIIKCPYCGGRLTDVGASVKVELYRHPDRGKMNCHGYLKCQSCKDEVGIVMA